MKQDRVVAGVLGCAALVVLVAAAEVCIVSALSGVRSSRYALLPAGVLVALPVAAMTVVAAVVERRNVIEYGLAARHAPRMLACGAACAAVLLAGFMALLTVSGNISIAAPSLSSGVAGTGALLLGFFALFAFAESLFFHGLLLTIASRYVGFPIASITVALAFGLVHAVSPATSEVLIVTLIATGLALAAIARITGSIWWGVGFLTGFDWGQLFVFGNPRTGTANDRIFDTSTLGDPAVTGGAYGIEASIVMLPVALAVAAVMLWVLADRDAFRSLRLLGANTARACTARAFRSRR
jgi:membrane protease YdiL (CAAX protease family)